MVERIKGGGVIKKLDEKQKHSELRDWFLPMLMNGQVTIKDSMNKTNPK